MTRKEQETLHARVLDRVRRMTPKEGFRALIESGIFTEEGELAPEYGGPERHSQKRNLTNKGPSGKVNTISRAEHERILRMVINHWRKRYERLEKRRGSFEQIHREKIREHKAQIRARAAGKTYHGFTLAKNVDPVALKRPLNLSRAKVPKRTKI